MSDAQLLGAGYTWQELSVGQRFRTFRRTITETDIINFISVTGMLETIFIDGTFEHGAMKGRPAPGGLTYGLIEGLLMQGMVQGLKFIKKCCTQLSQVTQYGLRLKSRQSSQRLNSTALS